MKIKVKKKALVSVLLSFVMIMGLFFVPKVNAEDNVIDQGNTISFQAVQNDLEMVDGVILEADGKQQEIDYPAGLITDNLDALTEYLTGTQTFQKAIVRDTVKNTETPIARIGTYNGVKYYSLNNQQDIGIQLEANEEIVLICASKYTVTYEYTKDYGTVTGPSELFKGEDLNISIQANDTYHIKSVKFNGKEVSEENIIFSGDKNASVKIEGTNITDNVKISVEFAKDEKYSIIEYGAKVIDGEYKIPSENRDGIQQGDLCGSDTQALIDDVEPGSTASFWLYSQSNTGRTYWVLNMLTINGEDINIPYAEKPGEDNDTTETTLSNGSVVTLKLIYIDYPISWKKDKQNDKIRTVYQVTVTKVRENLTFEGNFKEINNSEIIITGLDGIKNVGASEVHKDGNDYFYELQPNDTDKVYSVSNLTSDPDKALNIYFFSVKDGYNPYTVSLEVSHSGNKKNLDEVVNNNYLSEGYWMTIDEFYKTFSPDKNGKYFKYYFRDNGIFGIDYNPDSGILGYYNQSYNFWEKVIEQKYTHVFVLNNDDSVEAKNQVAKLTAHPYEYQLVFSLNGGSAELGDDYTFANGLYTYNKIYTLANGSVYTHMPNVKPTKENNVFVGWKLRYADGTLSEETYSSNEAFAINETSIKHANGDSKSDKGHTFTFVAQWQNVKESAEIAELFVQVYQEVNPGTSDAIKGTNGKYYKAYGQLTSTSYGTVGSSAFFINLGNNPDSSIYEPNITLSKRYIETIIDENADGYTKDNNTFKIYYDFKDYDLTVKKEVNGEYADLSKDWNIELTLLDSDGKAISNFKISDELNTNDDGIVNLSLGNKEEIKIGDLNINTQYSIKETGDLSDYTVTYKIGVNNATETPVDKLILSADTTVTVINTMNDDSIEIPDTNVPTSGADSEMDLLAIGSFGIVSIVVFMWYWRKKHV